jgi:hypothetical protein
MAQEIEFPGMWDRAVQRYQELARHSFFREIAASMLSAIEVLRKEQALERLDSLVSHDVLRLFLKEGAREIWIVCKQASEYEVSFADRSPDRTLDKVTANLPSLANTVVEYTHRLERHIAGAPDTTPHG